MSSELDGRVAVVTGAAKGLGRAIATRLADEGATVVVSDLDAGGAEATAASLPGGRGRAAVCDVRREQDVTALFERTVEELGGLHVLVANAGVGSPCPLLEMDLAAWRAVTEVNLDGVFLTLRHGAPVMVDAGGGAIVTVGSVTAATGSPLIGHYAAAKAGVVNLTKTLATELRPHGVRVNTVLPGFVDTDLVTAAAPGFERLLGLGAGEFDGLIAGKQGRYGTPEEVAEAVLFLASDRSGFCTGTELVLDGGMRASLL